MVNLEGAKIKDILDDSIAAELEIEPGDILLAINGTKLLDYLDFLFLSSEEEITLEVLKKSGEIIEYEFEKDSDEPLGLVFEDVVFDGIRACTNHCLFCFVHQLPAGQRDTLYIKDDDYRLSFLNGCYITLTNLSEEDWQRIERMHLSPLYISVHATEPQIRKKLLGFKDAGSIIEQLRRLCEAGITVHTQAVICPEINDGPVLERTINDLATLWPEVMSLAVVPVGLTGHREKLFKLRPFTSEEAGKVLDLIEQYQHQFYQERETRFVFAADEWYLLAGRELPEDSEYEGYPQLDNGVGLIRWFLEEFNQLFFEYLPQLKQVSLDLTVITGKSPIRMWQEIAELFAKHVPKIELKILPVENQFFGQSVTVTGLLAGNDIIRAIQADFNQDNTIYLIPQITLKQGEDIFLDGVTLSGLKEILQPARIGIVTTRPSEWLEWIIKEGCVK